MEKVKELLAMNSPLFINILMSIVAYFATSRLIPSMENMFIKANLYGVDMNKKSTKKV